MRVYGIYICEFLDRVYFRFQSVILSVVFIRLSLYIYTHKLQKFNWKCITFSLFRSYDIKRDAPTDFCTYNSRIHLPAITTINRRFSVLSLCLRKGRNKHNVMRFQRAVGRIDVPCGNTRTTDNEKICAGSGRFRRLISVFYVAG